MSEQELTVVEKNALYMVDSHGSGVVLDLNTLKPEVHAAIYSLDNRGYITITQETDADDTHHVAFTVHGSDYLKKQ